MVDFDAPQQILTRAIAVLGIGLLTLSCSTQSSAQSGACERAAIAQAEAEEAWGKLLEEHIRADQELAANPTSVTAGTTHDDSAAFLVGARVDVIIAETETRNSCG